MADKNQPTAGAANTDPVPLAKLPLPAETAPEELTGRATGTDDDLTALFKSDSGGHFADGFSGGSDDDKGVAIEKDDTAAPEVIEDDTDLD
jgi:hypothetical protein